MILNTDMQSRKGDCIIIVLILVQTVCVRHGELVFVMCGACHPVLIVPSYHYRAVVCHYMMNLWNVCWHSHRNVLTVIINSWTLWQGMLYGRMASPLGCSVFQCCSKYDFEYEDFMSLSHQYIQGYYRGVIGDEAVARVWILLELLFIRSGVYQLNNFSVSDVKVMIDSMCTC